MIVIGGGDFHCGLGSLAVGLEGQPAALEALSAAVCAADTGTVDVVVVAVADFFPGLKMA